MAQKATSILLAILILAVSMGLTINKHYCQNELKATAVFTTPPSCHTMPSTSCQLKKAKSAKSCCSKANNLLVTNTATCAKDCCHNESEYQHLEAKMAIGFLDQRIIRLKKLEPSECLMLLPRKFGSGSFIEKE